MCDTYQFQTPERYTLRYFVGSFSSFLQIITNRKVQCIEMHKFARQLSLCLFRTGNIFGT